MVAKLTQARYGYKSWAANLFILLKALIVKTIAIQRAAISTKANKGFLRPKKTIDQNAFKVS